MKDKFGKNINIYVKYSPLIICLSILLISIGYATVNSVDLNISGNAVAMEMNGLFVTEAVYSSGNNVVFSDSSIRIVSGTTLNSNIVLSSDSDSSITYKVTIYNGLDYNYQFVDAVFDNNFYDNENIVFELSDELNTNVILEPTESITFYLTFKYVDGVTLNSSLNTLNAYINFNFEFAPTVVSTYSYTGNSQDFIVPDDGIYKIELWGAGAHNEYNNYTSERPSYGGYVSGEIYLTNNDKFYVYVGGRKQKFNMATKIGSTGGGGATDIRLVDGTWDEFESLASRIMVAGGAGGSYYDSSAATGGHAGGLMSTAVSHKNHPIFSATQTAGGKNGLSGSVGTFGKGGINQITAYNSGGGGYFGGGSGPGSGGGSSFISGHNGCVAITEDSTEDNIFQRNDSSGNVCADGTIDIQCSYHYSNYIFSNTIMIDGGGYAWTTVKSDSSTGMPTHDGSGTMQGNGGNGYVKITLLSIGE